jgi:mannosyltransferase
MAVTETRTPARSVCRPEPAVRQAGWLPERLALWLAAAAAVALHVAFVWQAGALWRDEVNTVEIASSPTLAGMWRLMEFDSYPILWPLLLRGWMAIAGDSDAALRLAGLASGLALPFAVWVAARLLCRTSAALAIALLAVSPTVVMWGSSARAWGLGTGLAAIAFALLWRACEAPTRGRVAAASVGATLSVQCLYQNALLFAAMATAAVLVGAAWRRRGYVLAPIIAGAVAAASLLPYAATLSRAGAWTPLNVVDIGGLNVFARFLMTLGPMPPFVLVVWLGVLAVAAAAGVRALAADRRGAAWPGSERRRWAFALLVSVAAPALLVPFYAVFDYPANPWYFIGLAGLLAVATAAAVSALPDALVRRAAPVVVLVVLAAGVLPTRRATQRPLSNMDVVARELAARAGPSDLVVASPWLYGISLRRYVRPDVGIATIPPLDDFSVHRFDLVRARMTSGAGVSGLLDRMDATLLAGHRVWIVGDLPPAGSTPERPGPPPLPDTQWRALPYIEAWTDEVMVFLDRHAVVREEVPVTRRAQPLENARLAWFSGWR